MDAEHENGKLIQEKCDSCGFHFNIGRRSAALGLMDFLFSRFRDDKTFASNPSNLKL